jgi:hypothetical protein
MSLPNDFIVDLLWPVRVGADSDPAKFHIFSVDIFGEGVILALGYDGESIGSVTISSATFAINSVYGIAGTGDFLGSFGKVVIGSLTSLQHYAGHYEFNSTHGRLSPTVIRPNLRGVQGILIQNGDEISDPIYENVVLRAGRNFQLSMQLHAGTLDDPHQITLSAISGAGLNEDCACDDAANKVAISTINGIAPDGAGNFTLLGGECIDLTTEDSGLTLVDKCSTPCCGCQELDVVQAAVERLTSQIHSLENVASKLEAATDQLFQKLVLSR